MTIDILEIAAALSDGYLLTRLHALAGREREASAELVAHLAALDARPGVYAAQGYGSLFAYCTQALRLSEDAACNRIEAARACRTFPVILDLLASGALSLTTVRLLRRHLTPENHEAVLARATGRSRHEIDILVAELSPQPDVPASVRRLPTASVAQRRMELASSLPGIAVTMAPPVQAAMSAPTPAPQLPTSRPIVQAMAPERYRVQFTVGQDALEKLRRLQALLRREIPDGDPATICDRAWTLLLEHVEKTKLGRRASSRPLAAIRSGTDKVHKPGSATRHIPRDVKRAVWQRDGGQCAFVSADGRRRCSERAFLEFHHVKPYARQGPANVGNISLRCRRHNQYESELIFGPQGASVVSESWSVGYAALALT